MEASGGGGKSRFFIVFGEDYRWKLIKANGKWQV